MHGTFFALRTSLWRRRVVSTIVGIFAVLSFTGIFSLPTQAAPAPMSAKIKIDGSQSLGTVRPTALGINTAVWDTHLTDPALPDMLTNAGAKMLRYPGGSTSDVYHWQTNTTEANMSYADPKNNFDAFMAIVQKVGATPIITVNYGSGSPAEAAAWVQYANITKQYGVKYWEIGNELYGNGTYGAKWEYDLHPNGATTYANNALLFIQAMKAVDPSIKIAPVLTVPGDWPDNNIAAGDMGDWNHTVLSILGNNVDFADQHWYADYATPGNESDPTLLRNAAEAIPEKVAATRSELHQYAGKKGTDMPIMITETNSVPYSPGKQSVSIVDALYMTTDYMNWLENGVVSVDWWALHNGIVTNGNNSASLHGTTQYGDYGVLSSGGSSNGQVEPPVNTPFPTYYSLQMLHNLIGKGGDMLTVTSDQSLVEAHVISSGDGKLAVMLINKDPANTYQVSLSVKDASTSDSATVSSYSENGAGISVQQETNLKKSTKQTLAPYSITTIVFN